MCDIDRADDDVGLDVSVDDDVTMAIPSMRAAIHQRLDNTADSIDEGEEENDDDDDDDDDVIAFKSIEHPLQSSAHAAEELLLDESITEEAVEAAEEEATEEMMTTDTNTNNEKEEEEEEDEKEEKEDEEDDEIIMQCTPMDDTIPAAIVDGMEDGDAAIVESDAATADGPEATTVEADMHDSELNTTETNPSSEQELLSTSFDTTTDAVDAINEEPPLSAASAAAASPSEVTTETLQPERIESIVEAALEAAPEAAPEADTAPEVETAPEMEIEAEAAAAEPAPLPTEAAVESAPVEAATPSSMTPSSTGVSALAVSNALALAAKARADLQSLKRKLRESAEEDAAMEAEDALASASRKRARPSLQYASVQTDGDLSSIVAVKESTSSLPPVVVNEVVEVSCPITVTVSVDSSEVAPLTSECTLLKGLLTKLTHQKKELETQVNHYESIYEANEQDWCGMRKEYYAMQDALAEASIVKDLDLQLSDDLHARELEKIQMKYEEKSKLVTSFEQRLSKLSASYEELQTNHMKVSNELTRSMETVNHLKTQHQCELEQLRTTMSSEAAENAFKIECPIQVELKEEVIVVQQSQQEVVTPPMMIDGECQVDSTTESFQQLESQLLAETNRSATLESEVTILRQQLSDFQTRFDSTSLTHGSQVATLETELTQLRKELVTAKAAEAAANEAAAAAATPTIVQPTIDTTELEQLRTSLSHKTSELSELNDRLTSLESENDRLTKLIPTEKMILKLVKATREVQKKNTETAIEKVKMQMLASDGHANGENIAPMTTTTPMMSTLTSKPLLKPLLGGGVCGAVTIATSARPKLLSLNTASNNANAGVGVGAPKLLGKVGTGVGLAGVKLNTQPMLKTLGTSTKLMQNNINRQQQDLADKENIPIQ